MVVLFVGAHSAVARLSSLMDHSNSHRELFPLEVGIAEVRLACLLLFESETADVCMRAGQDGVMSVLTIE